MPDIEDVSYTSDDEAEEKTPKVDKAANFQNPVNLTDEVAKGDETSNVMFSPTSLNFALGMIAEGAKVTRKKFYLTILEQITLQNMRNII